MASDYTQKQDVQIKPLSILDINPLPWHVNKRSRLHKF